MTIGLYPDVGPQAYVAHRSGLASKTERPTLPWISHRR
jgi:hypothetical protein